MNEERSIEKGREGRKRFSLRALILTGVAACLLTIVGLCAAAWLIIGPEGLSLAETMAVIRLRFVGPYESQAVMDETAGQLIASLGDRWSYYMNREEYEAQKLSRDNSYVGIGVVVSYEDERGLLVLSVSEGGPAAKAGIQAGDLICSVDGVSLAGQARYDGAGLIRGQQGSAAALEVMDQTGRLRQVQVTRDRVETEPVEHQMLSGNIGLVTIRNFFNRSADGVQQAVEELIAQGAVALVFDVRNNGGGYLDQLTQMLDYLLPEGPIFRSHDKQGREQVFRSDEDCASLPMAVLINENTYSAAEFFAAQLRESVDAVVAGSPTTGKGYSQQVFPLLTGGAINLSTNAYLTGGGVSLAGTGLTPLPQVALEEEEQLLLFQGSLEPDQDPQLQAAIAALF